MEAMVIFLEVFEYYYMIIIVSRLRCEVLQGKGDMFTRRGHSVFTI